MIDRKVSLISAAAVALWGAGLTLVLVGFGVGLQWGILGLYVTGIGGWLSFRQETEKVVHARQNVFDMGRDYERGLMAKPKVTSLH